jgi:mono/diheme cytochrome c family protein
MLRRTRIVVIAALAAAVVACNSGRHSSSGFRLPGDGDIERGKAAFVALGCNSCHRVSGVELPGPTVQPAVPVVLGGEVHKVISDGYLAASIINPGYALAHYPKQEITVGGKTRMPSTADTMTVRQLTDLVAFLQSRYVIRMTTPKYAY